ncbi:unnamed protein product [Bursaphelenchus xylophilus]|uniref:(pine wood nematode) hypothetical protein n=1 Tax=Bursaphelenchus xylophilus TaxID=6326 RepID=A0A1I7SQQ3_BURXY|nr:unnamed protein product [Bursaphelenchus xylophilus]CAG9110229.1 unnamed protein product [Bursaphelenchus xylophilus]
MEDGIFHLDELTEAEKGRLDQIHQRKDEVVSRIHELESLLIRKQDEIDSLNLEEIDYHMALQDPKLQIRAFNKKPKLTMDKLVEGAILEKDPATIAKYLYETRGLSKKAIGEYLGADGEDTKLVLKEFIKLQSLEDLEIVPALRTFLNSFQLGGESQIIDRVLETFSNWFCESNSKSSTFINAATCHTFLYAVLMLNTSLHNPKVVHSLDFIKPADFLKICEGTSLSKEFLLNVYNEVKAHAFVYDKFADITKNLLHQSSKTGFLLKQSSKGWKWNKRWFALMEHCLYYFEDHDTSAPRGIISLESIRFRKVEDRAHPYCLELFSVTSDSVTVCKLESIGTVPKTSHGTIKLAAETEKDLKDWMTAIEQSAWIHEYYDLIQLKRTRSQKK